MKTGEGAGPERRRVPRGGKKQALGPPRMCPIGLGRPQLPYFLRAWRGVAEAVIVPSGGEGASGRATVAKVFQHFELKNLLFYTAQNMIIFPDYGLSPRRFFFCVSILVSRFIYLGLSFAHNVLFILSGFYELFRI